MKRIKYLIIILSAFIFTSCNYKKKAIYTERIHNFNVEYLFEKDGIKVYRFEDCDRMHYFTTNNQTISTQPYSNGKQTYYKDENINQKQK